MSHRVTTQTQIKDKTLALEAFAQAGVKFKPAGANAFDIESGRSKGKIDLSSGVITGDTDRWADTDFDVLRQAYAEGAYVSELRRQGATIQSRTTDQEGNIVIVYQTTA